MRIGIIGGGRVGNCLAAYFADTGLLVGITAGSIGCKGDKRAHHYGNYWHWCRQWL